MNLCPDKYQHYAAALIVVAKNFETSIKQIEIQFCHFPSLDLSVPLAACVSNISLF